MKIWDLKQAAELLGREWNLGKKESGATGSICAWIYLMDILKETERMATFKVDGRLVGFCGYSNVYSRKHLVQKKLYSWAEKMLIRSRKIKDKDALREYYANYDYLPEEMYADFDGEISILIVSPEFRGSGLGKKLLSETFKNAANDGLKNLMILSDESCSYHFYESMGCTKVYETIIENKEYGKLGASCSEKGFVYEKRLC